MKKCLFTIASMFSLVFLYSQNVGIGTVAPVAPLHIYNSSTDELVRVQGNNPYIGFRNLAGTLKSYVQGYGDHLLIGTAIGNPSGEIRFYNNNIANMVILPNGNVGIGNSTPGAPLSFPNLLGNKISFWRNGPNNDFGIGINSGVMQIFTAGMDKIAFGWGNANAFTETITFFTGNGNIGLGTTNPATKIHINKDGEALRLSGNGSYFSLYTGNTYKGYLWNKDPNDIELGTATGNTAGNLNLRVHGIEGLTVQNDGRVRVGELACNISAYSGPPKFSVMGGLGIRRFDAQSTGEWAIVYYADNDLNFFYNGGFKAYVSNVNGAWISSSDQRLKEDLQHYKPVIDGLKKLDVLTYHFKDDKRRTRSFGLLAQNLQQYFPELVSGNDKEQDRYLGIDYGKTGVLAIKAIQEQQEIIETQQKKIETLEKRLAALESKQK